MTLLQLRYLLAIQDAGLNISEAAKRMHATQPGVSKQLRQIESELGFRIFDRHGKSLRATTLLGAEVLSHARAIVAEAAVISAIARSHRDPLMPKGHEAAGGAHPISAGHA